MLCYTSCHFWSRNAGLLSKDHTLGQRYAAVVLCSVQKQRQRREGASLRLYCNLCVKRAKGGTHMMACFSVRELRYLWTWAWLTPYRANIRKIPPTPSVQKVWRSRGSGFRLHGKSKYVTEYRIQKCYTICKMGYTYSMLTTHSSPAMRLPLTAFLHTSAMPPACLAPTTMTASWPANITTVWNTSVQITAFRPPWYTGKEDSFIYIFLYSYNKTRWWWKNKEVRAKRKWWKVFWENFQSSTGGHFVLLDCNHQLLSIEKNFLRAVKFLHLLGSCAYTVY